MDPLLLAMIRIETADELHMSYLRTQAEKRRATRRRFGFDSFAAAVLIAAAVLVGVGPFVGTATACVAEDSSVARIGTDRLGCVWWAQFQGNGQGRTVWNRPNR